MLASSPAVWTAASRISVPLGGETGPRASPGVGLGVARGRVAPACGRACAPARGAWAGDAGAAGGFGRGGLARVAGRGAGFEPAAARRGLRRWARVRGRLAITSPGR